MLNRAFHMNYIQKIGVACACVLLLGVVNNTVQAKSTDQQISKAELQQAYKRLVKSKVRAKTNTRRVGKKVASRSTSRHSKAPARYQALRIAKQQLRKKYRWGGTTPQRGFDCSGLMQYAYKSTKVRLPRTAAEQYRFTKKVPISRMQTGDLIFFHTRISRKRVNHVGIYVGGGNFIHAPRRGKRVSVTKLNRYWKRRVVGVGRV